MHTHSKLCTDHVPVDWFSVDEGKITTSITLSLGEDVLRKSFK